VVQAQVELLTSPRLEEPAQEALPLSRAASLVELEELEPQGAPVSGVRPLPAASA
jgi:hypothetical protein